MNNMFFVVFEKKARDGCDGIGQNSQNIAGQHLRNTINCKHVLFVDMYFMPIAKTSTRCVQTYVHTQGVSTT